MYFEGFLFYAADEEKMFRLPDSRASDGKCVISTNQVYSEGDTFRYGQHMWYAPSFTWFAGPYQL